MKVGDKIQVDIVSSGFEERSLVNPITTLHVYHVIRINLEITETQPVEDLYSKGYGQLGVPGQGYKAIDSRGVEWSRDWEGAVNDGPGNWHAELYGVRAWAHIVRPNDSHLNAQRVHGNAYEIEEI